MDEPTEPDEPTDDEEEAEAETEVEVEGHQLVARDVATGMATGKRLHKPLTIASGLEAPPTIPGTPPTTGTP